MWTVVYIASNNTAAENLKRELVNEGLLVNLRTAGASAQVEDNLPVEILVPETEAEEAHEILNNVLTG